MSIGTAERPINIKDLILDTPERARELPFDPERELTAKHWSMMQGELDESRHDDLWGVFLEHASRIRLLNPDYNLGLTDEAWAGMRRALTDARGDDNLWGIFAQLASEMKLLDQSFSLSRDDPAWVDICKRLDTYRYNWWEFAQLASEMKILDPSYDLGIDQSARQGMREQLDFNRTAGWLNFAQLASEMKLLDPLCDLGLTDEAWAGMRRELDPRRRKNKLKTLISHASNMKILAAEEVKVTDKGVKIIMRKPRTDFSPSTPPMPEVRRF